MSFDQVSFGSVSPDIFCNLFFTLGISLFNVSASLKINKNVSVQSRYQRQLFVIYVLLRAFLFLYNFFFREFLVMVRSSSYLHFCQLLLSSILHAFHRLQKKSLTVCVFEVTLNIFKVWLGVYSKAFRRRCSSGTLS